jgi:hypothetical protein
MNPTDKKNKHRAPGVHIIARAIVEQNKLEFAMAIGMFLAATLCFILSKYLQIPAFNIGWVFFLVCGLIILFYAIKTFKLENNKFYKRVAHKPKSVVWVYHQVTQVMPFGIELFRRFTIYIHTIDGKCYSLQVKGQHIMPLLKYMESIMPQATFGHSVKKEQLYKASPVMLLRD